MIETKKTNSWEATPAFIYYKQAMNGTLPSIPKEKPKTYNPCPLDTPFEGPKTLSDRIWFKIVDLVGWFVNLFR